MKLPNINFIMELTKDFLDGKIDGVSYSSDFEDYLEEYIEDMEKEDEDYSYLIYEYLYEDGVARFDDLPDKEFETLIRKHYRKIRKIAREGFY
jgi:chloramphenicol O-acetyltransferase